VYLPSSRVVGGDVLDACLTSEADTSWIATSPYSSQ
jgi:hypothetical protein